MENAWGLPCPIADPNKNPSQTLTSSFGLLKSPNEVLFIIVESLISINMKKKNLIGTIIFSSSLQMVT